MSKTREYIQLEELYIDSFGGFSARRRPRGRLQALVIE
jgi:hypothetical protein